MHVINIYRCYDCSKIIHDLKLKRLGKCPRCGGSRFRGANPTFWEEVWIRIQLLFEKEQ